MPNYINLKRDSFLDDGVAPRQRKVYVLRWNPSVSGFTRDDFENYFAQYKGEKEYDHDNPLDWTVWDWKSVEHRDLFVMVQVGQEVNGIVWGGFLGGFPYQYEDGEGNLTKSHFFKTDVQFMHRIEKTGVLTAERLQEAIPEVDWLHGHSGELLSTEAAEKLGRFIVKEMLPVEASDDFYYDSYCEKKYVIADILTYMCTELKKSLRAQGKINNKHLRNVHNMMVKVEDDNYSKWDNLEDHLSLEKLNGVLL